MIPNAVDFSFFANAEAVPRKDLGLSDSAPLTLFVGRLDPQKAPLVLLEAFARLHDRHPDWQLLFVGEGVLRSSMTEWIANHGLERGIRIVGWRPNVPQILKAADVLVLPSLWEGMPNIVLEAMASGLPVVVSRVEGTDELIRDRESGLLVAPGSVAELELAIEAVLTDRDFSSRLAREAQQTALISFTFESMVTAYEQLYSRLMVNRSL